MKFIKYLILGIVAASAGVASAIASTLAATHAAQSIFNQREFDFSRDVVFKIPDLQEYSVAIAEKAVTLNTLYQAGILAIAIAIIWATFSYPSKSKRELMFQKWMQAVRRNDSLAMATIETEVRDQSDEPK